MSPLPSPDEVLERLDPLPGEQAGYIQREDVRFGWIYFMSVLQKLNQLPGSQGGAPDWSLSVEYSKGDLVTYGGTVYRATKPLAALSSPPGTTTEWIPIGAEPKIHIALAVGQDPSNYAFPGLPRLGDVLFNLPDKHTWIFGPNGWQHVLIPPVDSVFGGMLVPVATTANQFEPGTLPPNDAGNPGTYYVAAENVALPANFPTMALRGITVNAGDWLVDDGNDWVWIQMSQEFNNYVTTDTAGENPTTWIFGTAPINGDIFANTADNRAWLRLPDPNAPAISIWVEITTIPNTVTTTSTPGDLPTTHTPALNPVAGDLFLNYAEVTTDVWNGTAWVSLPGISLPAFVSTDTAGVTPTTYTPALTPGIGDFFANFADDLTWLFIDDPANPGTGIWHLIQHPDQVTISTTTGETPITGGATSYPVLASWDLVTGATPTTLAVGQMSLSGGVLLVSSTDSSGTDQTGVLSALTAGRTLRLGTAADHYLIAITGVTTIASGFEIVGTVSANLASGVPPVGATSVGIQTATAVQAEVGDVFINRPDQMAWIFGTQGANTVWEPISTPGPTVTVSDVTNEDPGTFAFPTTPRVADVFHNETDEQTWVYGPDPSGTGDAWFPINSQPPESYVSDTAGEEPAAWVAANSPDLTDGDLFINRMDRRVWVYGDDPTTPGTFVWIPFSQGRVFTSDTAGQVPAALTVTPIEGDTFINTADGLTWVWGPDPINLGNDAWIPVAVPVPSTYVSDTTGEGPAAWVTANAPTLVEGDIFLNTADNRAWIWADDAANAGQFVWLDLSTLAQIIVSETVGETPAAPGTTTMPTVLNAGARFINEPDERHWVYYRNALGNLTWAELPMRERVTVFTVTGESPAAPPTPLPAPTRIGDMVINTADHFTWVFDGAVWQEIVSLTTTRGRVTYAGAGPFDSAAVMAPLYGMPANALPDPSVLEPEPNDAYIDSTTGDVWILT
jgi:hypothetical protein